MNLTCPHCGKLKPTEVVGTKLPGQPAQYFCGKCGRRLGETGKERRCGEISPAQLEEKKVNKPVKTYREMNSLIVGLLRTRGGEIDLYAAARIEELEKALTPFAHIADLWDELRDCGLHPTLSAADIVPLTIEPYRAARKALRGDSELPRR